MKCKILTACLILLLALPAFALRSDRVQYSPGHGTIIDFRTFIDANQILMFVTNKGSFAFDNGVSLGKADGLYFPYTGMADIMSGANTLSVIYAGTIWAGATVSAVHGTAPAAVDDTIVTSGLHDTDWGPGPLVDGAPPSDGVTNSRYRVYKLYKDSVGVNANTDWLEWPVDDGAPVDENGDPLMIGDQMCWSVYNDLDVARHNLPRGTIGIGLGLEVRQTAWAYAREGALANIVFIKFEVFNEGPYDLDDMFLSLWSDPDLGDAGDDLVGSDDTLSLGYCYNEGADANYGSAPPAVGYDFFQGPLFYTGNDEDVAKMWGEEWPGYINQPMSSFMIWVNPDGPDVPAESFNFMNGLNKDGSDMVDPTTGLVSKFFGNGDPITGTGWLDANSADRRFMQSVGPISFAQGDSTEIVAAILVGQGTSELNSIFQLKSTSAFAQKVYDNNFELPDPPVKPNVVVRNLDNEVILTWDDTSEVDPGDYSFEGYALFQGASAIGPWTDTLMWSDVRNGMTGIIDYRFTPAAGGFLPYVAKPGSDEGLRRYFSTTRDISGGGNLINYTSYYYRVEAYSVDTLQPNGERTLTSATVVTVMPQPQFPGTEIVAETNDTLFWTHSAGAADGSISVSVVDPAAITGDDYKVTFDAVSWYVINTSTTDTVVNGWANQGDDGFNDFPTADGLLIKAFGPAPGVKPGDMFASEDETTWGWDIPNGTRRWTWGSADGFAWEGFRGALGWGGPGDYHGFGGADPVPPENLPNVLIKLAPVAADGTFDPNHENVSYAYRYLRGPGPPARPEFAPYIVDETPPGGSYGFQDFAQSMPLSAWNVDVDPPQRLAVGYLENNAINGLVDGKYWPGTHDVYDNISGDGPREWLWIYLDDYQETPKAEYSLNAIDDPMPVMYWATWNRHATSGLVYEDGDEFLILPNKVNSTADEYTFTTAGYEPSVVASGSEDMLDNIKTVPNPYYLFSDYDASLFNRNLKFINLPAECTIEIYTLSGDLVRTIEKEDLTATELSWDLLNVVGVPVGSGIYIYVVNAPAFGQKIGKMAVFTEVELLDQY